MKLTVSCKPTFEATTDLLFGNEASVDFRVVGLENDCLLELFLDPYETSLSVSPIALVNLVRGSVNFYSYNLFNMALISTSGFTLYFITK